MNPVAFDVQELEREGLERVYRLEFGVTVAFLAIHGLVEGRSFGGIRIKPYGNEELAERDAHALARAMTRKTMVCGIRGGGAKTVLIEPPREARATVIRTLGRFINSLGGAYYCGGDFGFTGEDLSGIRSQTSYVACGDLAEYSARSVVDCMLAISDPELVIVQGLGAIGSGVVQRLGERSIQVLGTDVKSRVEGVSLDPAAALSTPCDVFSPCAIGGVIDEDVAKTIPCKTICGGANNPLASEDLADVLHQRGIVYVPDFIASAGATAAGASRAIGETDQIEARMKRLPELTASIVSRAKAENRTPLAVALELVDERLGEAG